MEEVEIVDPYGFVYITTNMINGKMYIGQKKFIDGWKYYLGSGTALKLAIIKYGKENFNREIISIAYSKEQLNELEIEVIKNHNAVENRDYYNLNFGGGSPAGIYVSEETRKKLSIISKNNNGRSGKHCSDETKNRISKGKKGKQNGENNPFCKLNNEDVLQIKEMLFKGDKNQTEISKLFNISDSTVSQIKTGKAWTHIILT